MEEKSGFGEQMPQTIGRYKVQENIGYGAMGAVYKAFDPLIKRTLAIKTIRLDIPRQSPQYKSFIERFYHEARISGTLSHPNIVTLFDIGEEGGIPYLAMEFVEGETISSMIERGVRFKPEKVISLVSQIASAVDYAHSKGVIHRDIKPSNLILFEGDRVKVTDFGIAKLVDSEMTQSGTLLGTPSYMSPEQAMGDKLDGRSDIFSLGVCAFEMLSGEQPFPGANVTSILYKLVHVDPVEPENLEMNGLVPQKWHEVFGKVLAKKPDDRYQTSSAFVQDLEYCLGAWFGAAMGEEGSSPAPPTSIIDQASLVGDAVTKTIPRAEMSSNRPAAPPAEEGATVVTAAPRAPEKAAPAAAPATLLMKGPVQATVLMKAEPPRPSEPEAKKDKPPPLKTVLMSVPPDAAEGGETVRASVPQFEDDVVPQPISDKTVRAPQPPPPRPAPPAPTTKKTPVPVSEAPPAPPPPAPRSAFPTGLVLGGVGLVMLLVVALGAYGLVRLVRSPSPTPVPIPQTTVATTLAPTPVPTPTPPPVVPTAALHVESEPPGASVSVNGLPRGVTPIDLAALPFGDYDVKVELKGFEARSTHLTLNAENATGSVNLSLPRLAPAMALADILSTPFGAAVSVDGRKVGQTPLTDFKVSPGTHQVQVTHDGYDEWNGPLKIDAGKRARLDVTLKAIPIPSPSPSPQGVDPNRVYLNAASEVDTLARKLSGPSASYPQNAPRLRAGESVSVSIEVIVSEKGEVENARVLESGGKAVDDAVLSVVRRWRFQPAVKQGLNVKVRYTQKLTFQAG
jgi:TonB family protein